MQTLEIAAVIVVVAVCIVLSIIPAFPIIGAQGLITLGALSGVVIGLFLGIRRGIFAVILVAIVLLLVNPGLPIVLGPLYFLPVLLGFIGSSIFFYRSPILGVLSSTVIPLMIFILVNYPLITYYWSFIIYDLVVPFAILLLVLLTKHTKVKHDILLLGAVTTGIIADHIGGSLAFIINNLYFLKKIEILLSNPEALENWAFTLNTVACIYPVERTILIIIGYLLLRTTYAPWKRLILDKIRAQIP